MNILLSFKYLANFPPSKELVHQVTDSYELEQLSQDIKLINREIEKRGLKYSDFYDERNLANAKKILNTAVRKCTESFNDTLEYDAYLWLDEICSVIVENNKAVPLEDSDDYANFEILKKEVQGALQRIYDIGDIKPDTYSEIFFVIYIDIIDKDIPLTVIDLYPDDDY